MTRNGHDAPPGAGDLAAVTHHAPSALCLGCGSGDDPMASAMASRCDETVRASGADLWAHGHVPGPVDLFIGTTRVVATPHGRARPPTVVDLRRPVPKV